MRLALLLVALGAVASGAEAQQLDFKRVSRSGDELLSYRWRDHDRHVHDIAFTLTRQAIREAEDSFAQYSVEGMWQVVERDLRDEVARFGDGARIDIRRTSDGVRWTIEARKADLDELTRKVEARLRRSERDYLARHLRQLVGERRIIVDFAAATGALQGPLRAVARALGDVPDVPNEERARVALALGSSRRFPTPPSTTSSARAATSCRRRRCWPRTVAIATARRWRWPPCCATSRAFASSRW